MTNPRKAVIFIQMSLIVLLGFIIYANSLDGQFIWDDFGLIKDNAHLRAPRDVFKFFLQDMGAGSAVRSNFYRPLQMSINVLNYCFFGLDPRGYHFTSVLLHIISGLSIFWLVGILFFDNLLAFLAALLFVAHPVQTEAVDYIAGLSDPLAAVFILLTLITYIKYLNASGVKWFVFSALSFALALLSKESSIILPLLMILIHYILRKKIRIASFSFFLAILILYAALRVMVIGFSFSPNPYPAKLIYRIFGFFASITDYARILTLPLDLRLEYENRIFHFLDYKVLLGIAISVSIILITYLKIKSNKIVTFSVYWFFICLLPFSNILSVSYPYMMEHWVYLPSLGFFIIIASALIHFFRLKTLKVLGQAAAFGIIIFYSCLTIKQNMYWKNPVELYKRAIKYNSDSWMLYNGLALAYEDAGNTAAAFAAFKRAIEINQNESGLYYNLGNLYRAIGQEEEAINTYKRGKEIETRSFQQFYEAANKCVEAGKNAEAIALYGKALALDPNNLAARIELGNAYVIIEKHKSAILQFKKALELNFSSALAYNNLALAYYYNKQYDLAIENCDKAIELGYKVMPNFLALLKPYRKFKE